MRKRLCKFWQCHENEGYKLKYCVEFDMISEGKIMSILCRLKC